MTNAYLWRVVGRRKEDELEELASKTSPQALLKALYNSTPRNPGKFPYNKDHEIIIQEKTEGVWKDRDLNEVLDYE